MTAVLFDMDGVIVDSEAYWEPTERTDILPTVVPEADVDVAEITGRPYREIYTYLDEHYEVAVSRERFLEMFESAAREIYSEKVALLSGFEGLRAELADRDVPVALVTSSPYEWVDIVRDRFGLTFDAVVSAEDVDAGKPEPDIYEAAAAAVDCDPSDCVAVEDSTHGARAATAAGTYCIGYVGVHDSLDRSAVAEVASTPVELRTAVLRAVEN
jgi:HAD superfamily hydrolase (TIGR01509 family)